MIFVDMAEAESWTGRPASVLRRWVHEGRLTRYGTCRQCLFDLYELPAKDETGRCPTPPVRVA